MPNSPAKPLTPINVLCNSLFGCFRSHKNVEINFSAHEYCKVEGNVATIGITDFAQAALGDIVFVDLPEAGDEFEAKDSFGSVESVKAASDVYAPISGKVLEVNDALSDDPGMVNTGAEDAAWFIKMEMSNASELEGLMNEAQYKDHCEKEAH